MKRERECRSHRISRLTAVKNNPYYPHHSCFDNFALFVFSGGFIQEEFSQKDLKSKTILYIIDPYWEGNFDNLEIQVTNPDGMSVAPQM